MIGIVELLIVFIIIIVITLIIFGRRRKKKLLEHVVGKDGKIGEIDLPKEKSPVIAYIFYGLSGVWGGHRYYLGKYLTAVLFTFTVGLFVIGFIVDAFCIPRLTREVNRRIWENWFAKQSDKWTDSSGTVCDLNTMQQMDMAGQTSIPKQVMNFRIEETDEDGDITKVVEVELIGNVITGNLRNGDRVMVRGKLSKENILRALSAENKTTNSLVKVSF